MVKNIKIIFASFVLILSYSCRDSFPTDSNPENNLVPAESEFNNSETEKNYLLWKSKNIQSYTLDQFKICMCEESYKTHTLFVKKNVIDKILNKSESIFIESSEYNKFKTVDELFKFVNELDTMDVLLKKIDFDPVYGYPNNVKVVYSELYASSQLTFSSSNIREVIYPEEE